MIRYICEPEKNTECRKTFCQEFCKATAFEEYAKRDENGAPIVAKDFEIIPQIKINREVFEKCEEETETITVSKGCLKARKGRFVVYDVEYLKNHIEQEAAIYRNVSAITGKTNEQAIRRLEDLQRLYLGNEKFTADIEAIGIAIEALKKSEWIPCSERLPEDGDTYLVTIEYNGEVIGVDAASYSPFYGYIDKHWDTFEDWKEDDDTCYHVTAWMPLPEEYKKEGNK